MPAIRPAELSGPPCITTNWYVDILQPAAFTFKQCFILATICVHWNLLDLLSSFHSWDIGEEWETEFGDGRHIPQE
jgi:hypothetical protein